jgi:hypothetical protein
MQMIIIFLPNGVCELELPGRTLIKKNQFRGANITVNELVKLIVVVPRLFSATEEGLMPILLCLSCLYCYNKTVQRISPDRRLDPRELTHPLKDKLSQ